MLALSIALLLVSLLAVVLLAKKFSLVVDVVTAMIGAPPAFAGVLVALLILLPEGVAAVARRAQERPAEEHQSRARLVARDHRADDSGGRRWPPMRSTSNWCSGSTRQDMVLLLLTFVLSMLTFGTGRTNILFGLVHMVVFAVFLFMVFVP